MDISFYQIHEPLWIDFLENTFSNINLPIIGNKFEDVSNLFSKYFKKNNKINYDEDIKIDDETDVETDVETDIETNIKSDEGNIKLTAYSSYPIGGCGTINQSKWSKTVP